MWLWPLSTLEKMNAYLSMYMAQGFSFMCFYIIN